MTETVAVLASGSGTNLQALIDARLPIALVLVNRPGARAIERAERAGIPVRVIDHTGYPDRLSFDSALVDTIREARASWVILAGFMRILGKPMLEAFPNRILNIHPSLLPAFPGLHAQRQALRAGARISGCTVHLVNEGTDTGAILGQAAVPVLPSDDEETLSQRILVREHQLYPAVIQALLLGGLRFEGSSPRLAQAPGLASSPEVLFSFSVS